MAERKCWCPPHTHDPPDFQNESREPGGGPATNPPLGVFDWPQRPRPADPTKIEGGMVALSSFYRFLQIYEGSANIRYTS